MGIGPVERRVVLIGLLIGGVAAVMLWVWVWYAPKQAVLWISRYCDFPLTRLEKAEWEGNSGLLLEGLGMEEFARIEKIRLVWRWKDLILNRTLESIEVEAPQILMGRLAKELKEREGPQDSESGGPALILKKVEIRRGTIWLDELVAGLHAIPISIGRNQPLDLREIQIGGIASAGENDPHVAEVHDIVIYSPYDAVSPVIGLGKITLTFTWKELAHQQLRKIEIDDPTIFLGPDLFDFAEALEKRGEKSDREKTSTAPWMIHDLQIRNGRLTVNAFGQPGVTLPFYFGTSVREIRNDRLNELTARNALRIPETTYTYPEYGVRLRGVRGEVAFALPLGSAHDDNNVVNTVMADAIEWKGLEVVDSWVSVTFDKKGIYTRLGGRFYGGYLGAEGHVLYEPGFPWEASFYGTRVGVGEVTRRLVGEQFTMTGLMSTKLQVKAIGKEVSVCEGKIKLDGGGTMEIRSIDKLLNNLPEHWNSIQKGTAKIMLESFRTYHYTGGEFHLKYDPKVSYGMLDLEGKQGRRRFEVRWFQE